MSAEGKRSEPYALDVGDIIKIGTSVFVVQAGNAAKHAEAAKKETPQGATPGGPEEEGKESQREGTITCKVCLKSEANGVFIPCGHNVTCYVCAKHCKECPLCRKEVFEVIRIYKS